MNAHVNPLSSDRALTAEMIPHAIANAFKVPRHATLIEALIGAEILKNVRKGAGVVEDVAMKRHIPDDDVLNARRANLIKVLRVLKIAFSKDIASKIPEQTPMVVHNDLIKLCNIGAVDRMQAERDNGSMGWMYWVILPDDKQDEFAWMETWNPTPMEGKT
jgi:hypothetical protein